jgi:alanine racemase
MAVVKADAYGHGAVRVARELAGIGIRWFGVATAAEGAALREAGIEGRILVFAAPLPEHLSVYVRYDLELTVTSSEVADAVIRLAGGGDRCRVHVKVDTGMGRIGLSRGDAAAVVAGLERGAHVEVAGLWTHLATADAPDLSFAREQLERFAGVVAEIGDAAERIHVANSAAALRIPDALSFERPLARIGIGLYGYTSLEGLAKAHDLRPVMRVTSTVTHVKRVEAGATISYGRTWKAPQPTRIATVGAGYADGYHRLLSNRASVGIRGRRYPVTGTVCMDVFMVDLGPRSEVAVGDEVILFGDGGPDAVEVAGWAETIPYEVLTSVSSRVPRTYAPSQLGAAPAE